ncbi:hypothetical protein CLV46_2498 [Diaminobutyricimonas aerilata]|uniref:Ig-like domain-containing protein n=1 Tax=Diaminobutyricimonas aerilata TaxID=1162967 RepID=A0A2M9CM04_9MICO|nr:hypothetical protein [Diaminobutyricimonas aerilata]PJJ72919.1 hypothetical protein CLV46_2498 [Diaminobutyricimonas aerilata]
MTTRTSSRRVAAGAATGAILLSLAYGGAAAVADEIAPAVDAAPAATESPAQPAEAPAAEAPAAPAVEQAPDAAPAAASPAETLAEPSEPEQPTEPDEPTDPQEPTDPEEPTEPEDPDVIAPALVVAMPAPAPRGWYTEPVSIELVAGDAESGVASIMWQVDGGPAQTIPGDIGIATIGFGGDHEFAAWAVDVAGNSSEVATRTVMIDMAAPYVQSFSQPQDAVFQLGADVTLEFECSDDLSGVDMCITGELPNGKLDTSTVGDHTVDVIAVDVAGNQTVIPYRYSVTDADTSAPAITATASGTHVNDQWFTGTDAKVTLEVADATEEGVSIHYTIPGMPEVSVDGTSTEFLVPSDGAFDIAYYAEDAAGNRSETQTITVRRDTVVPTIAYAAHYTDGTPVENGAVVPQNAEIEFGHECVDSISGVADCTSEVQNGEFLDTKDLGGHSVLLMSTDAAGNEVSVIFDYTVEEPSEPTDPGNGGEEPTDPVGDGGAPAQPGTGQPAPAVVTPARNTADDDRLASTGVSQVAGIAGLVAALLAGGFGLTALGVARRRRAS